MIRHFHMVPCHGFGLTGRNCLEVSPMCEMNRSLNPEHPVQMGVMGMEEQSNHNSVLEKERAAQSEGSQPGS